MLILISQLFCFSRYNCFSHAFRTEIVHVDSYDIKALICNKHFKHTENNNHNLLSIRHNSGLNIFMLDKEKLP